MVYGEDTARSFDGFVSCFFIDTAPNILDYVIAIRRLLRPGGVWINLGPLQYHWSDEFSEFAFTRKFHIQKVGRGLNF